MGEGGRGGRGRVQGGLQNRGFLKYLCPEGGIGHEVNEGLAEALPQTFLVRIDEGLVLDDGAAGARAELVQGERRQGGAVERRACIQSVVAHRVERAAVEFVRA